MSRVAVVTGAAEGIGQGVAIRLAADGYKVAALDINEGALEATAATIRAAGGTVLPIICDVADRGSVDAAFAKTRADLGPTEVLVANAGVSNMVPTMDLDQATWNRTIAINLTGVFSSIQNALPDMLAAKWGRIVTISSSSAQSGAPAMAHYVASKGGVIGLTKAIAREFAGQQITCNTIPPSIVDTPMAHRDGGPAGGEAFLQHVTSLVPLGRMGTPADIAAACAFLVSEEAGYITGQVIGVNGGMYI